MFVAFRASGVHVFFVSPSYSSFCLRTINYRMLGYFPLDFARLRGEILNNSWQKLYIYAVNSEKWDASRRPDDVHCLFVRWMCGINSIIVRDRSTVGPLTYFLYICVCSPRWTSGSPRMLLLIVLIREFESRRGEILNLFAIFFKKKDQLLRTPSVGKHSSSTQVDEGRKSWNLIAIKMQRTNRGGKGGRRACYVTPDLSYD